METVIVKFEWYKELLRKLEDFYPYSQKISGELRCAIEGKWKNIHGYICIVDTWPDFTTVIWKPDMTGDTLEFLNSHLVIVTKNKDQLKKMLQTPGVINWSSCCRFLAINEELCDVLREVSEDNGGKFMELGFGILLSVNLKTLKTVSIPEGFSLKPLTKADVPTVVKYWDYSKDGVLQYLTALIEDFSSVALYNQEQQLVGYMLETNYGTIGLLHVFEEFRGQGHSKVIVSSLAKKLLENGRQVHLYIFSTNTVSQNLHKSLGFHEHPEKYSWFLHEPM